MIDSNAVFKTPEIRSHNAVIAGTKKPSIIP